MEVLVKVPNFILQSQNDGFGICNGECFHSTRKTSIIHMRSYL
jgi:hypothetical protein